MKTASITISSGTRIGSQATITGDAVIGKGCVIGSNAAVTRGILLDNAFTAGVPIVLKRIDEA